MADSELTGGEREELALVLRGGVLVVATTAFGTASWQPRVELSAAEGEILVLLRDEIEVLDASVVVALRDLEVRGELRPDAAPLEVSAIGDGELAAVFRPQPGAQEILVSVDYVDLDGELRRLTETGFFSCTQLLACEAITHTDFLLAIGAARLVEDEGRTLVMRQAPLLSRMEAAP